jgi:hypothetical protein
MKMEPARFSETLANQHTTTQHNHIAIHLMQIFPSIDPYKMKKMLEELLIMTPLGPN